MATSRIGPVPAFLVFGVDLVSSARPRLAIPSCSEEFWFSPEGGHRPQTEVIDARRFRLNRLNPREYSPKEEVIMTLFTRLTARDFPMLFHHCIGRTGGQVPPVVIRIQGGTRTVFSTTAGGVILTHSSAAPSAPQRREDCVVLPAKLLAEVAGNTQEPVCLERQSTFRGMVRWRARGEPRRLPVELITPGPFSESPTPPSFTSVSARLLIALSECGQSAARQSSAYALSKIQVQGGAGRVIATDGICAILCDGLSLPFVDTILVPALSVFGARPFARVANVKVGLSPTHLVVVAGPWSVALPTDTRSRYPDVASAIPRPPHTIARIARADAAELLKHLPELPGKEHELQPVTIDATGGLRGLRVLGQVPGGLTSEVTLGRSQVEGSGNRVAIDRRVLARALTLGCHTLKLTHSGPIMPIMLEGDGVCLLVAPFIPALIVPRILDTHEAISDEIPVPLPTLSRASHTQSPAPKSLDTNDPTQPQGDKGGEGDEGDANHPFAIAEELRATLTRAATLSARLLSALRPSK